MPWSNRRANHGRLMCTSGGRNAQFVEQQQTAGTLRSLQSSKCSSEGVRDCGADPSPHRLLIDAGLHSYPQPAIVHALATAISESSGREGY